MTKTLVLEPLAARYLAKGLLGAINKASFGVIATSARIEVIAPNRIRGISTDRFRIHLIEMSAQTPRGALSFNLPVTALQWLRTNATKHWRKHGSKSKVTIAVSPSEEGDILTITVWAKHPDPIDSLQIVVREMPGTWPDLMRLIHAADAAPDKPTARIRVDAWQVGLSSELAVGGMTPTALMRFTEPANPDRYADGPTILTYSDGKHSDIVARAYIQPHILQGTDHYA